MSYIYHIVKFKDGSAYVMFDVCSWKCLYCVRNISPWCSSLPANVQIRLKSIGISYISAEQAVKILKNGSVKLAFLGGGEPTQDPDLLNFMKSLKREGIDSWLITNGENLNDEIFELSRGITFSIKALDEEKHLRLTGRGNKKVLENFRKYANPEKVVAETVYFPKLVDCDEIINIARFVEEVDSRIKLRVDPAVQLKSVQGFKECVNKAKEVHEETYRFELSESPESPELLYPSL